MLQLIILSVEEFSTHVILYKRHEELRQVRLLRYICAVIIIRLHD